MLVVLVHFVLFLVYASVGLSLGAASYYMYDYTLAVSVCLGGLFTVASGLFHLALTPRTAKLDRYEKSRIDNELLALKDSQAAIQVDVSALSSTLLDEARERDAMLTRELRELAVLMGNYIQKNSKNAEIAKQQEAKQSPRRSDQGLLSAVRAALEENRVELHLQPIVALPQRKIVYYEGFTRLKDGSGAVILPGEFLRVAEPSGLVSEIDNLLLLRCVQIARKLIKNDRRIALFCNVSPTSLADEAFFPQFIAFLRDNKDLAGSIIFEITREAFDHLPMAAERNMGRLFDLGFRFSIDRCETIDLDLRKLERMGVRYVKIAGDKLVKQLTEDGALPETGLSRQFEPHDIASVFMRYGVELIADKIEDERTIVEILELDIAHAQGILFGYPRPSGEIMEPREEAPRLRVAS